jgi:glutathione S-transferase
MITIHHLDKSRSERIVWLVEELDLPYQLETTLRENGLAPASYRAIHPLGRAPIISDGELVLIESGAIVDYLISHYGNGRLRPSVSSPDYARYLQWLHYAEGTAMSSLLLDYFVSSIEGGAAALTPRLEMVRARNTEMLSHIDTELGQRAYFAGAEFSCADIMMEFCFAFLARAKGETFASYPHIADWLQRIHARPAYAKSMQLVGPKS